MAIADNDKVVRFAWSDRAIEDCEAVLDITYESQEKEQACLYHFGDPASCAYIGLIIGHEKRGLAVAGSCLKDGIKDIEVQKFLSL